ncbi:uncharacterized protein LOC120173136 [Hibiscus syriacus]|uniref:uncharacterized protein LOC120173136 n=1 Tax=Hibiscus syriacus TaxID=106335 RepID=UPI0019249EB1|nr:uncharacterized protein LOC120173136 [Hibiscus syriacus]
MAPSKKLEYSNHDKGKQKAAPKKPNIATKDPGKTMKQASARPQTSQACILRINIQLLLLLNTLYHMSYITADSDFIFRFTNTESYRLFVEERYQLHLFVSH